MAMLKNNSVDCESEIWFPEVVIQHIQSFMSGKEAVQTSILSKSWHTACSTRPNLDFSQRDFKRYYHNNSDMESFLESSKKTIQRYEESNLRIESFRLTMDRKERESCVLGDELIARALKLGAAQLSVSVCYYLGYPHFLSTNAWDLRNLEFLHLDWLNIDPLFSHDSSCEFSSLKVLTIDQCRSEKGTIRISGASLERISFARTYISCVALDVPNIRKFYFSGHMMLPSLTFEAITSTDWVSNLSFVFKGIENKTSWFLELEKFLEELRQSKISLNLEIGLAALKVVYDYARESRCLQGKPAAVVEKLTVKLGRQYIFNGDNNILECLFQSVEPKLIFHSWERSLKGNSDDFLEFLCKALNKSSVEEVNVECFEEALAEWRPLSFNTLLDASASLDDGQLIRFRLKWRVL